MALKNSKENGEINDIIFYNVYECCSSDEDEAVKDVDTSKAGANVLIADGTTNNINGSYVAKIYKSVKLNEEGTEAAAVTVESIIGDSGKPIPSFIANRPFFYAIVENSTNAILFMGKVTNPKE